MRRGVLRTVGVVAGVIVAAAAAGQEAGSAVRNVTPSNITPGPAGEGPLVREPAPPAPPPEARWRRYFLPVTTDSATFHVDDGKLAIHIAGVTAPAIDETCTAADGSAWPCGRTALHQFRMFLRGRAIECYFPPATGLETVTAPCRVGQTDLGLWLLKQGWAKGNELSTDDYLAAAAEARCGGVGIWRGSRRPDYCPPPGSDAPATLPVAPAAVEARVPEPAVEVVAPEPAAVAPQAPDAAEEGDRARFSDDLFE